MSETENLLDLLRSKLSFKSEKITPLPGGWRKKVFLVEGKEKQIVCLVPKKKIKRKQFLAAIRLEEKLTRQKVIHGRKLIKFLAIKDYWIMVLSYVPGEVRWQWGEKESFKLGELSKILHQKKVYHFDLKPGNILWEKNEIVGVLDFEEAQPTRQLAGKTKDLANTLSWVLISGGSRQAFLKGYGRKIQLEKIKEIDYYLAEYLKMRAGEGSHQAFLLVAKNNLDSSRQKAGAKMLKVEDLADFRKKNSKKKIVFTVGAFELLHYGHLEYLKRARKMGDLLVVGVGSDESRRRQKGEFYPIIGEKTRAETLIFFDFVDGVVIVEEDDVLESLKKLKPEVFYCTEKDWQDRVRKPAEEELIKNLGGKIVKTSYSFPKIPSSKMVEEVAMLKIKSILLGKFKRQPLLKLNGDKKNPKEIKNGDLVRLGKELHRQKKTVVFTSGSADLFHVGHARFFQKAKSLGDVLVVGIPSNRSVTALKGYGRPIVDESARAMVIAELADVNWVTIFDERTILKCLQKLKPDVFFTVKEDWNAGVMTSPEALFMKSINGKIVMSERQAPFLSASKMIDKTAGTLIQTRFADVIKTARETAVLNADFDPYAPESQLTAREKGFYEKVLEAVAQVGKCVFCDLKEKYLIKEENGIVLTVALYPYIDGHLLIIPRRHFTSIKNLTAEEWQTIMNLFQEGARVLKEKLGVENVWFLIREGEGIKVGKTVEHLHFHLMPYDLRVIKMGETKLTVTPLEMANKLREK